MTLIAGNKVTLRKRRSLRNAEDMEWGAVPAGATGEILSIEETYGKQWASIRWMLNDSPMDDQIIEDDWESYLESCD